MPTYIKLLHRRLQYKMRTCMYSDLRICERFSGRGLSLTVLQPDSKHCDSNTKSKPNFDSHPCFKAVKDNYTKSMNQPHEPFKFDSLFDVQVGTCISITSWLYAGAYIEINQTSSIRSSYYEKFWSIIRCSRWESVTAPMPCLSSDCYIHLYF